MSNLRNPRFLDKTAIDEPTHYEKDERERRRRVRGICLRCGRALRLGPTFGGEAQLLCSCGYRTTAKLNSRAYRNASLIGGAP